jgi:hypothetical protein
MTTTPPFYVGQEVVCVKDHTQGIIKNGQVFKVTSLVRICCGWNVTIGIQSRSALTRCGDCGSVASQGSEWQFASYLFAPKDQFKAITFTKVLETELVSEN